MKNQKKLVFGLITVLIVVIFALLNTNPASINFGFTHLDVPLILLIVLLLLIGAGVAFLMGRGESKAAQEKNLTKQLEDQKKELTERLTKKQAESEKKLREQIAEQAKTIETLKAKLATQQKSLPDSNSQNQ